MTVWMTDMDASRRKDVAGRDDAESTSLQAAAVPLGGEWSLLNLCSKTVFKQLIKSFVL